jgi:NADH:ubiquinone reductase (H+-translocating)
MDLTRMTGHEPHVLIVGGGFGGLNAARALRREAVRITLVDRRNHHLFQPLLYQVATAALSPADIAAPIRHILRKQRNTQVLLADVSAVSAADRAVVLSDGRRIEYDYLILATGAVDQYFGRDEWAASAPGLKTIDDATTIRRRFLLAFEAAEQESDPEQRSALLTFVVVGGGPTGVEMAGAFAEIAKHTLAREFRNVDSRSARVILVEGGSRVLSTYPEELSARARRTSSAWVSRSEPARWSPASTPTGSGSGRRGSPRGTWSGPRASAPRRWGPRSALPSIAWAGSASSPTSACRATRRSS